MPISRIAQAYVAHKIKTFADSATSGSGQHYELYAQRFTDSVDALAGRMRNKALREHLLDEARKTGDYCDDPGHWVIDPEGELTFRE